MNEILGSRANTHYFYPYTGNIPQWPKLHQPSSSSLSRPLSPGSSSPPADLPRPLSLLSRFFDPRFDSSSDVVDFESWSFRLDSESDLSLDFLTLPRSLLTSSLRSEVRSPSASLSLSFRWRFFDPSSFRRSLRRSEAELLELASSSAPRADFLLRFIESWRSEWMEDSSPEPGLGGDLDDIIC